MLEAAIHLVHGDTKGGELKQLGAQRIVVVRDLLTVGRSDLDPVCHRALRRAQWKLDDAEARVELLEDLEASLGDRDPIVLWTSPAWSARLYEWHTIAELVRLGIDRRRVSRVEVPELAQDEDRLAALEHPRPLDDATITAALELWSRFVAPTPLPFDELRRRGSASYPDLGLVGEGHGAWFPSRTDGALRLSYADQVLLDSFDIGEPKSPTDALFRGPRARDFVDVLLRWFGDGVLLDRIGDWQRRGAFELYAHPELQGWARSWYRLTPLGAHLRDEGAREVGELAPLDLGGCRINDPASPWVREDAADGWRLVAAS